MMRRMVLLTLLIGLMGSRWEGRPIVALTLEAKLYSTGDAVLVVDVAEGIFPEDLLGKTMIYDLPDVEGQSQAVIYLAQRAGENIKVFVTVQKGSAPLQGGGAIII